MTTSARAGRVDWQSQASGIEPDSARLRRASCGLGAASRAAAAWLALGDDDLGSAGLRSSQSASHSLRSLDEAFMSVLPSLVWSDPRTRVGQLHRDDRGEHSPESSQEASRHPSGKLLVAPYC